MKTIKRQLCKICSEEIPINSDGEIDYGEQDYIESYCPTCSGDDKFTPVFNDTPEYADVYLRDLSENEQTKLIHKWKFEGRFSLLRAYHNREDIIVGRYFGYARVKE